MFYLLIGCVSVFISKVASEVVSYIKLQECAYREEGEGKMKHESGY